MNYLSLIQVVYMQLTHLTVQQEKHLQALCWNKNVVLTV